MVPSLSSNRPTSLSGRSHSSVRVRNSWHFSRSARKRPVASRSKTRSSDLNTQNLRQRRLNRPCTNLESPLTMPDIPSRPNRTIRLALTLARLALVLAVLWQGARFVFRYDPRDDLRRVDALFVAGRYHDALDAADGLAARAPRFAPALVRLGMLRALRDERPAASRSLAQAIGLGLSGPDRDLARLYQGRVAAAAGLRDEARQFWTVIDARSPLFPLRRVLEAESLLAVGDYAGAEAAYRTA